jgi:acyl-CoA dehydrogenase
MDGLGGTWALTSEAVAIGSVALRRALDYAKERAFSGRPIGANQAFESPLRDGVCAAERCLAGVPRRGATV